MNRAVWCKGFLTKLRQFGLLYMLNIIRRDGHLSFFEFFNKPTSHIEMRIAVNGLQMLHPPNEALKQDRHIAMGD